MAGIFMAAVSLVIKLLYRNTWQKTAENFSVMVCAYEIALILDRTVTRNVGIGQFWNFQF